MILRVLIALFAGGLIGYITNALAIKMLFRPFEARYLGSFRLPFTPGLIPKEKARLARAVGEVVGGNLLDEKTLRAALLSEEMLSKVAAAADGFLEAQKQNDKTLRDCLSGAAGQADAPERIKASLSDFLAARLIAADLGEKLSRSAADSLSRKASGSIGEALLGIVDARVKASLLEQIRQKVNAYVERHAAELAAAAVGEEIDRQLEKTVGELLTENEGLLPALKGRLPALYESALNGALPKILREIDLAGIVRGRIEAVDNRELEQMVMNVAKRELNAIVYLGALLGFVMGALTLLAP